ncbi:GNAT family protein [Lacticaseibacillus pabuli]|uniref:GNAT family protein n=1 Tax=Lacticaseibacillus pabuli TaxID=3025672 RepID=A0ABY7WRI0_9LACO|nr:GNAT family protein [Lacticaseibacillus sp. KACC 23028]WDF82316.1 GNAT family protein [Lacticaseibacillus sp. KACC 23028]
MTELSFLSGPRLTLRNITEADYPRLIDIENTAQMHLVLDEDTLYPRTNEDMARLTQRKAPEHFFAIERDNSIVGIIGVFHVDTDHLHCEIGLELAAEAQNPDVGKEALTLMLNFIFNYLPTHKVKLRVDASNDAAIKLYEELGFTKEGTLRDEIFRGGEFQDVALFAIMRHDWETHTDK